MTVSRALRLFAVSLALAALTVLLGPGDAQAKVKCGSILGPGGTYVLDRNLRCRSDKHVSNSQPRVGVLRLTGGATLNLNGHTVTCKPGDTDTSSPWASDRWGIVVRDSTVTNGTVRGCSFGVIASGSLVKGMILDGNGIGVILREKFGGSGNVIMGKLLESAAADR